ncbi:hypothetical protein ACMAZF_16420 [Psychrobium sp. nBUS_13]|uniref:hypothetical protein n=1 Tax=Psychrobium sp. nBUS_13 TaxID=3395319 RepID=UPI003EB72837
MADIPLTPSSVDNTLSKGNAQLTVSSSDSTTINIKLSNAETILSQILAKSDNQITLSIPNNPPLKLDVSQQPELAQRFAIGDKVTISLVRDNQHIIISVTPQPNKAGNEFSIPASQQLIDKLSQQTSFPPQTAQIISHLTKHNELQLGQARRLPQDQLQLKTNTEITLKAPLPGVSKLPLNTTMHASLVLSKDDKLLVQFIAKPISQQPTLLVMPLRQLNNQLPLSELPIVKVSHLSEVIEPAKVSTALEKMQSVDMTKPLNQLWLRHQPTMQSVENISNQLKHVNALSNEQLKAELNHSAHLIQGKDIKASSNIQQTTNTGSTITPPQTVSEKLPTESLEKVEAKPSTTLLKITPLTLKELNAKNQLENPPNKLTATTLNNEQSKDTSLGADSKTAKETPTSQLKPLLDKTTAPINEKTLQTSDSKAMPIAKSINDQIINVSKVVAVDAALKSDVLAKDSSIAKSASTNVQMPPTQSQALIGTATKKQIIEPPTTPSKTSSNETTVPHSAVTPPTSVPLQKLNALIGMLNISQQSSTNVHQPTMDETPDTASDNKVTTDDLRATQEFKSLTQRVLKQLPAMSQLTNPFQLAQTVEQFSRFEPLSSTSVSLTNLGPLASALHLMLGGRHIANGHSTSPQLLKHLEQLVKKGKGATGANLVSALQMLGSLQSLKPLEEALSGLTSNIQFYQYQNAEQQQNNQSLFYFNIPTKESQLPQVEGEIEQENDNQQQGEKSWRLTLLLPCGEQDKIKVNALLTSTGVELDFTCNNTALLERANFYSSFLSERLETLGFVKPSIKCQEGEIPTTLVKRPNQLVELVI